MLSRTASRALLYTALAFPLAALVALLLWSHALP